MSVRAKQLLFAGAALAATAALLAILHAGAADSLRDGKRTAYEALLDAQVARLQQWIDERRADVEQLAADPFVGALAARLLAAGGAACAGQAANLEAMQAVLAARFGRHAPSYVHLLDADGRVMLSTLTDRCGARLPEEFRERLALARQRGSAFFRPIEGTQGEGTEGGPTQAEPLVWYEAPVRAAAGQPAAFVGYGVAAREAFGFLADKGRFGASGEIYVVDQDGKPISTLRWPVREAVPAGAAPLLAGLAAARAAGNETAGAMMAAYPNYAGREVVGVWRWLPRRGIGLVLEADAAETFGAVRYLRWMAWQSGALALLLLGGGVFLRHLEARGGRRVGPYRILGPLGEGAVSTVHRAEHVLMRRQVALKVLKPQAGGDEWQARFAREARLAGRLHHPNFVRLYDYGETGGGGFYYAMEYLRGCNFAELVEREGSQPPARVVGWLRQICAALEEAHGLGLLHRDIKPQNLMLCEVAGRPGVVKVLDFGLVKQVAAGEHSRDLTAGLRILGTPAYLAPERITDPASADPRSDLYAVGAVGFFLLTGRRPFESASDLQLTHRILHEPAPRASACNPAVPPELEALIDACLAKAPADRPASARAMIERLDAVAAVLR